MTSEHIEIPDLLLQSDRPRLHCGLGALQRIAGVTHELGCARPLIVSDPGVAAAGITQLVASLLDKDEFTVSTYSSVGENPTETDVEFVAQAARSHGADLLIGLGGGSAMDAAKAANFLLTGGGRMADYRGTETIGRPMLPFVAIPTTAGTGSEAQSYALITHRDTHSKMACGDSHAMARHVILDPELTATQPPRVAAAVGLDALTHAIESAGSTRRTDESRLLSAHAWRMLSRSFETAINSPANVTARCDMLFGAHVAGAAIERSMLGAAHACANALSHRYNTTHGIAVGVMMPHVIRFNAATGDNPYCDINNDAMVLADWFANALRMAKSPQRLQELGIERGALSDLSAFAATQWTGQFNPRPVDTVSLLEIMKSAY